MADRAFQSDRVHAEPLPSGNADRQVALTALMVVFINQP
jgi:hypothetical protein